jgi:TolA-binding protein
LIATLFAPRPAFAYGFAAVAIAAALFAWFWVGSENRRLKSDIARLEDEQKTEQQKSTELQKQNKDLESQSTQQSEELNAQLKTEREKLEQAQSQNEKLKGKIDALEKERNQQTQSPGIAAAIATFILRPGVRSNDDPERFSVSKNTRAVRFQLQIERGDDYPLYRTELRTAGGKLVWSQDRKQSKNTAAGKSVAVTIPASFLNSGEYELTLRGVKDGQIEDLRYYYFSILKR